MTLTLSLTRYVLPLRAPLRTSAGVFTERRGAIVVVRGCAQTLAGYVARPCGCGEAPTCDAQSTYRKYPSPAPAGDPPLAGRLAGSGRLLLRFSVGAPPGATGAPFARSCGQPATGGTARRLRPAAAPARSCAHPPSDAGAPGVGDAAPWPGFGDGRDAIAALEALGDELPEAPDTPWGVERAIRALGLPPEAACALEQALLDRLTRGRGLPLHRALGPRAERRVAVHALVEGPAEAAAAVAAGFRVLKVKVGDVAVDDARIAAIRAAAGGARLRLDANGAWGADEAVEAVRRLARHEPEWIEQPTRGLEALAAVRAAVRGRARIAVDEDLGGAADLERAIALGAADVAVIKPMFAGGLLAARHLALRAAAAGLQAIVTCALESAVGRTGALHLAATLPGGEAHGLLASFSRDLARFPSPESGSLAVPRGPLALEEGPC